MKTFRHMSIAAACLFIMLFILYCGSGNKQEQWVESTLQSLSLKEKIGQMISSPCYIEDYWNDETYRAGIQELVTQHRVGSFFIYFGTAMETARMNNALQELSNVPLIMVLGGGLGNATTWEATHFPEAMALGANGDPQDAFEAGRIIGREAKVQGYHYNCAPVVDVNISPYNPIINIRAFSEDPEEVTRLAGAYIRGFSESGLVSQAKHYPGHGDTEVDSHLGLPVVNAPRERLERIEWYPYRKLIEQGVLESVMTAHIYYPAIDGDNKIPATVSRTLITDVLQHELKLPGLIFTDGMRMKGITDMFGDGEAAIRAIEAGHDVLVFYRDISVIDSIAAAVESGRLSMERIDRSVRRILRSKAQLGLHQKAQVDLNRVSEVVNTQEHREKAQQIFDKSLTLLKNENVLPLAPESVKKLPLLFFLSDKAIGPTNFAKIFKNVTQPAMNEVAEQFLRMHPVTLKTEKPELQKIIDDALQAEKVVVYTMLNIAHTAETALLKEVLEQLHEQQKPVILVSLMNPYLIRDVPFVDAFLTGYGWDEFTVNASFRVLTGALNPQGKLPVTIPGLYARGHGLGY